MAKQKSTSKPALNKTPNTEQCIYKHFEAEVKDDNWRCPKCGGRDCKIEKYVNPFCYFTHDEDMVKCYDCGYTGSYKETAELLVKSGASVEVKQ
jgi:hypothetical protein